MIVSVLGAVCVGAAGRGCVDRAGWVDSSGDGCATYKNEGWCRAEYKNGALGCVGSGGQQPHGAAQTSCV